MTADPTTLLRAAAEKARRVAEGATPGPWVVASYGIATDIMWEIDAEDEIGVDNVGATNGASDAEHIATWHPGVALAVAALLEGVLDRHEPRPDPQVEVMACGTCDLDLRDEDPPWCADYDAALAVARELLGETGASDPEPATAPRSDEQAAQDVVGPKRRLRSCVEAWPECQEGDYHPNCCRFPKSCSATIYDERYVTEDDLEPPVSQPGAERAAEGREA